ncbi:MAG: TrmH family RNA methyltransferase [Chitinophagaceae bacterium]
MPISNNQIKWIKSLQNKKIREQENCFVVEGNKIVEELLIEETFTIIKIYALPKWINIHKNILQKRSILYCEINDILLQRISNLKNPHEVIAIVEISTLSILSKNSFTIALDNIHNPGNMGTIIRIADWFGCKQIICSKNSVDLYNQKVIQATMGSIFRIPVYYYDLEEYLLSQKHKTPIYASVLYGESVYKISSKPTGIILMGNESVGLSNPLIQLADYKITIPKYGQAESLNVSVAMGIILSHLI